MTIKSLISGNKAAALAALLVVLAVASVAYGQPAAAPPGGNVDANFNSVTLPTGGLAVAPKLTGSFGRFIGLTTIATTGNINYMGATGYYGGKFLCNIAFPGQEAHVCSAKEIMNSYEYNDGTSPINSATGDAWINNGPPAYITDISNDCNGWKTNEPSPDTEPYFGSTWKFTNKYAMLSHCARSLKIACCKY